MSGFNSLSSFRNIPKKPKIPPCAIRRTVYHMQSALGEGAAAGPQGRGRGDGPERISKKVLDKTGADL